MSVTLWYVRLLLVVGAILAGLDHLGIQGLCFSVRSTMLMVAAFKTFGATSSDF